MPSHGSVGETTSLLHIYSKPTDIQSVVVLENKVCNLCELLT